MIVLLRTTTALAFKIDDPLATRHPKIKCASNWPLALIRFNPLRWNRHSILSECDHFVWFSSESWANCCSADKDRLNLSVRLAWILKMWKQCHYIVRAALRSRSDSESLYKSVSPQLFQCRCEYPPMTWAKLNLNSCQLDKCWLCTRQLMRYLQWYDLMSYL